MADAPQNAEAAAAAGGGAAGAEAAAPKPSGGLGSYLPLIIVVVLMPVAAWVTLMVKSKMDKPASGEGKEEATPVETKAKESHAAPAKSESHGKGGKAGWNSRQRNPELPIPLTREIVAYQPAREEDALKPLDVEKIVFLDAKGEPKDVAQADKIVVNVANAGGRAYAVARFSLKGPGKDLIQLININRERLLDKATGALSSHTLEEIDKAGFRNLIRAELLSEFNQILGGGAVSDVMITEFLTQQ